MDRIEEISLLVGKVFKKICFTNVTFAFKTFWPLKIAQIDEILNL